MEQKRFPHNARMVPAFIYARQSKTRDGSESLDIQVEHCREAAARLGLEVVGEYVEPPSTSGYKHRGRRRAKFLEMLEAIRQGEAKAILVYKSERLSRGGGPGWAPVFDALDDAGLNVDRAVATPNGWMSEFEIGIRATMDREESKKLSDRMKDVRAREAKAGKPRGGGKRPFGYESDLMTVRADEAELIQDAVRRILAGESAFGVAQDWNRREVAGPGGGHWSSQTLKRILTGGRIAGLRVHNGEVVAEAEWPAILDRETWELVKLAVEENRTRYPQRAPKPRTFLLTGFARCGRCGSTLWGRTRNHGRREYACSSPQTHTSNSCGRLVIHAETVEQDVFEVVAGTMLDPENLRRLAAVSAPAGGDVDFGGEISELERRKGRLVDLYEGGDLDKATYRHRVASINERLEGLRAELANAAGSPVLASIPTTEAELRVAWEERGIEWQRLVVNAIVERLEIRPGRAERPVDRLVYTLR